MERELLDLRASRARVARERNEEELKKLSDEITIHRERHASLPGLKARRETLAATIERRKSDRNALAIKGGEQRATQLDAVIRAVEGVGSKIEQSQRRRQALLSLQDEAKNFRQTTAPRYLNQLQTNFTNAALKAEV